MTTSAEAASAAVALTPHVSKNAASGMHADTPLMAQCVGVLTSVGTGGSGASTALYSQFASAVLRASLRAAANGNFSDAEQLRTVNMVLVNLSNGV